MLKAILIMLLIAIVAFTALAVVVWREIMKMDREASEFCPVHDEAEPCYMCTLSNWKGGRP